MLTVETGISLNTEDCETEGKRGTPLAGEPFLLNSKTKKENPRPAPELTQKSQQEARIEELTEDIQRVKGEEVQGKKAGKEKKKREQRERRISYHQAGSRCGCKIHGLDYGKD